MKKLLLAAAAVLALTTAGNTAIISDLGLDPNLNVGRTVTGGGFFDDQFTFTLDAASTITIVAVLNTFPLGPNTPAFIDGFTGSVFAGTPAVPGAAVIGPTLATMGCGPVVNCQSLGGTATLDAGTYFLDFFGTAGASAAYGGTINTFAVPGPIVGAGIPGILAMFGMGGWAWRRRRSGNTLPA
jgi:hypothetical protein